MNAPIISVKKNRKMPRRKPAISDCPRRTRSLSLDCSPTSERFTNERSLSSTWLVGKVTQERALEKMRNLLATYPNVASRLATQPTGHFFVLGTGVKEIRSERSMMVTEQLSDHDIADLARATRPA